MSMTITFKDVLFKGKSLYKCRIKRDMTAEEVTAVLVSAVEAIEKEIDLSQVKLKKLGIYETCKLTAKNLLTDIINSLIAADEGFGLTITELQNQINSLNTLVQTAQDEKVKASATDTSAGFLDTKILTSQPGTVKYEADKITFSGFCPVGSVMMIDASRVGDFDGTGKGKANTDVWGWAISNGQNGTRNRLGKFPKFVTNLADAGSTGGVNSITIAKENIGSFDLAVSGAINDALITDQEAKIKFNVNRIADGAGGSTLLLRFGTGQDGSNEMKTLGFSLKHSHTFTLKSSHVNTSPAAISIIPEHINEIPIQRINV